MEAGVALKAQNGSALVRQLKPPLAVRCMSTTTVPGY